MANARSRSQDLNKFASPNLFKDELYSRLKSSGLLDAAKCELRKRILEHFRRDEGGPPDKPRPASIQDYMINTLIAEYLGARAHTCTLSVFLPEVSLDGSAVLTHDDILTMLQIMPGSLLHSSIHTAIADEKENGGQGFNLLQALLDSAKVIGSVCTSDASTNTQEDIVGRATLQLTSVDQRYISKHNRGSCDSLVAGRLADLQRDSEERIKIQVEAQVERVREIEVGQARMEEAAKWRQELASERGELQRLYSERMRRLRDQEDAAAQRARDLQREAERAGFEQRQRMVAEDDRIRSLQQERERDIHARQAAVAAREEAAAAREQRCMETDIASKRCAVEATARAENACMEARKAASAELASERATLRTARIEFEQERARILSMRDEVVEASAANAEKDARIERLLQAKADADVLASAHASEACKLQGQCSRLLQEFQALYVDVFGCMPPTSVSAASIASPGSGEISVTALQWVERGVEGLVCLRQRVQDTLRAHVEVEGRQRRLQAEMEATQDELANAKAEAAAAQAEAGELWQRVHDAQELLLEAREGRERALAQAEDCRMALKHAEVELREAEGGAAAARMMRDRALAASAGSFGVLPSSPQREGAVGWQEAPALVAVSSQAYVGSSVSSAAVIAQRLEQLEAEEVELQAEMVAFREKVARQQAQLRQHARGRLRTVQKNSAGMHFQAFGTAGSSLVATPARCSDRMSPQPPPGGSMYTASAHAPVRAGMRGNAHSIRMEPFTGDAGRMHSGGGGFSGDWASSPIGGHGASGILFAEQVDPRQQRSQSMRTTVEDVTHEMHGSGARDLEGSQKGSVADSSCCHTGDCPSEECSQLHIKREPNAGHGDMHGDSTKGNRADSPGHGHLIDCDTALSADEVGAGTVADARLSLSAVLSPREQGLESTAREPMPGWHDKKPAAPIDPDTCIDSSKLFGCDEQFANESQQSFACTVLAMTPGGRESDEADASVGPSCRVPDHTCLQQDDGAVATVGRLAPRTGTFSPEEEGQVNTTDQGQSESISVTSWSEGGPNKRSCDQSEPALPGGVAASVTCTQRKPDVLGVSVSNKIEMEHQAHTDVPPLLGAVDLSDGSETITLDHRQDAPKLVKCLELGSGPELRESSSASMVASSDLDVVGAHLSLSEANLDSSGLPVDLDQDDHELLGMDLAQELADVQLEDVDLDDLDIA